MSPSDIKTLRNNLGLTQESFAEAFGIATLTMSQYETGYRKPSKTLIILFTILESLSKRKALELVAEFRKAALRLKVEMQR